MNKHLSEILRKGIILIIVSIVFILIALQAPNITKKIEEALLQNTNSIDNINELSNTTVKIKHEVFAVEIADTPEERALGLQYRESLGKNSGMLFIFESESNHTFWMYNTYIPLDIIFLNRDRKIVHIAKNTTPLSTETINPQNNTILYAIEVNAGTSDRLGLQIGDRVSFSASISRESQKTPHQN